MQINLAHLFSSKNNFRITINIKIIHTQVYTHIHVSIQSKDYIINAIRIHGDSKQVFSCQTTLMVKDVYIFSHAIFCDYNSAGLDLACYTNTLSPWTVFHSFISYLSVLSRCQDCGIMLTRSIVIVWSGTVT